MIDTIGLVGKRQQIGLVMTDGFMRSVGCVRLGRIVVDLLFTIWGHGGHPGSLTLVSRLMRVRRERLRAAWLLHFAAAPVGVKSVNLPSSRQQSNTRSTMAAWGDSGTSLILTEPTVTCYRCDSRELAPMRRVRSRWSWCWRSCEPPDPYQAADELRLRAGRDRAPLEGHGQVLADRR